MESQHSVGAPICHEFLRFVIISQMSQPEVGSRWRFSRKSWPFWKKTPYGQIFKNCFPKAFMATQIHVLCVNFVKFNWPKIGKVARYLPDKNFLSRCPALASARIAPKICQGQLQTVHSECSKFHPSPFTSGGVIAGRVNIVETRHKVFPILSEAIASSPCNNISRESRDDRVSQDTHMLYSQQKGFKLILKSDNSSRDCYCRSFLIISYAFMDNGAGEPAWIIVCF